jgi:hypothetical protein
MDKIILLLAFADVLLALVIVLVRPSGPRVGRTRRRMVDALLRLLDRTKRK